MITIKQLENLQEDHLKKMSVPELKNYILDLATDYFIAISEKDVRKVDLIIKTFDKILELHEDLNLSAFINYSLITIFNKLVLRNSISVDLKEPDINKPKAVELFEMTDLERIVDAFRFKKVIERESELNEANLSKEELLELYHYKDYLIEGVDSNG